MGVEKLTEPPLAQLRRRERSLQVNKIQDFIHIESKKNQEILWTFQEHIVLEQFKIFFFDSMWVFASCNCYS